MELVEGDIMKRLSIVVSAGLMLLASSAWAQRPEDRPAQPGPNDARADQKPAPASPLAVYPHLSPGEVQAPPEMWFYEQSLRQSQDPKLAVRQAAEFRAEQRQRRIESAKWFGLSNLRPRASSDPIHSDYSPGWTSNNSYYPSRWNGSGGPPMVVVRPDGARAY
jgi:hypothetical protein